MMSILALVKIDSLMIEFFFWHIRLFREFIALIKLYKLKKKKILLKSVKMGQCPTEASLPRANAHGSEWNSRVE